MDTLPDAVLVVIQEFVGVVIWRRTLFQLPLYVSPLIQRFHLRMLLGRGDPYIWRWLFDGIISGVVPSAAVYIVDTTTRGRAWEIHVPALQVSTQNEQTVDRLGVSAQLDVALMHAACWIRNNYCFDGSARLTVASVNRVFWISDDRDYDPEEAIETDDDDDETLLPTVRVSLPQWLPDVLDIGRFVNLC